MDGVRRALLMVSFGTGVPSALEDIRAVEGALSAAAPGYEPCRAFTSPTVCRRWAERGRPVESPEEALERLAGEGVAEVAVQPLHLLNGWEYERLAAVAERFAPRFAALRLGQPLLAGPERLRALAELLSESFPPRGGEAVCLMGHGTNHRADEVYPALQALLDGLGREDLLVGTVEGGRGLEALLPRLRNQEIKKVTLLPLLLVAGEHALNDMAGEGPDSWKSRLLAEGYAVECVLSGLGRRTGVQALYCRCLQELLEG